MRLAVLIDAENIRPTAAPALLAEIAAFGTATVKRAYGDWTKTHLAQWKQHLLSLSIQPIQQFSYTSGKNATDSAMIIDALDLLYAGHLDGFCLASSDSDFTRLAARLRESGLAVHGYGERKTPQPFVAACDKFTYLENLSVLTQAVRVIDSSRQIPAGPSVLAATVGHIRPPEIDAEFLGSTVDSVADETGWAHLAAIGHVLVNRRSDFDPRTYGFAKLVDLFEATENFDVDRRVPGEGKPPVVYVRASSSHSHPNRE